MSEHEPQTIEKPPIGDFYELSAKMGYAIGAGGFNQKTWKLSPGAQLSLLHTVADKLGLSEAEAILWPMVRAICDAVGNIYPELVAKDAEVKHLRDRVAYLEKAFLTGKRPV